MQINFDATKLNKAKMRDGKYVELEVFALKEKKVKVKADGTPIEGDTWRLMKTHLVKQKGNKGEEMPIIGEGTEFETVDVVEAKAPEDYPEDNINPEDIPF